MTSAPVLIVDDHPLVAVALTAALRGAGLAAVRCAPATGPGTLAAIEVHRPRLVVLDLDLGDRQSGADLVPALRAHGCQVLVVTGAKDEHELAAAVARGAAGWIPKTTPFPQLVQLVAAAARGEQVLVPAERARLEDVYRAGRDSREADRQRLARLTPRESQVLARLAAGQRAERVAADLTVSLATVRTQIRAVLTKLDATSQLEAVAVAHRAGLSHGSAIAPER